MPEAPEASSDAEVGKDAASEEPATVTETPGESADAPAEEPASEEPTEDAAATKPDAVEAVEEAAS